MLARIITGLFVVAAIATIIATAILVHQYTDSQQGKWLMGWVSPNTLRFFVLLVLLWLPWFAIWQSIRTDRTMNERMDALRSELGPKIPASSKPGPNDADIEGMRWTWKGHAARGPFCPVHQEPLSHVDWLGNVSADNYEDKYLGTQGWFSCPRDEAEKFRVLRNPVQVKHVREQANGYFRSKFDV